MGENENKTPPVVTSIAEARARMREQYFEAATSHAAIVLDSLVGPLSPLALDETRAARTVQITYLRDVFLGVRDGTIETCAAGVEAMEKALRDELRISDPEDTHRLDLVKARTVRYAAGLRALKALT